MYIFAPIVFIAFLSEQHIFALLTSSVKMAYQFTRVLLVRLENSTM